MNDNRTDGPDGPASPEHSLHFVQDTLEGVITLVPQNKQALLHYILSMAQDEVARLMTEERDKEAGLGPTAGKPGDRGKADPALNPPPRDG